MNLEKLLRNLNKNKVNYVVIGGAAVIAHGYKRLTSDIDIFIQPVKENVEKVFEALTETGYDLQGTTVEEALQKKLLFRQYILMLDIHPESKGITFEEVWQNKVQFKLEGQDVYFVSLDDLILMKKAAGRPQDLQDLRFLEELKRQKNSIEA